MKRTGYFSALFLLTLLLIGGCSSTAENLDDKPPLAFDPQDNYRELSDYKLSFSLKNHDFAAGEEAILIVALRNDGGQLLNIADFRINHIDNIQVFVQNWFAGVDEPDELGWLLLNPSVQEPEWRYPLKLAPTNEVLFTVPLTFVEHMELTRGTQMRYFVKCRTNLQTVKSESDVLGIVIRHPDDHALIEVQKHKYSPQVPEAKSTPSGSIFQ